MKKILLGFVLSFIFAGAIFADEPGALVRGTQYQKGHSPKEVIVFVNKSEVVQAFGNNICTDGQCSCKNTVFSAKTDSSLIALHKKYNLHPNGDLRDERLDRWVQDIRVPGLWWYGYYREESKGSWVFYARHKYYSGLTDFQSLYPVNYRRADSTGTSPSVRVVYLGN